MPKESVYLIHFGLGGHGLDLNSREPNVSRASLSGYEDPETFEARCAAGDYDKYELEGVPVLDLRDALRKRPSLAYTMPMHDGRLAPDQVERLDRGNGSFLKMLGGMNRGNTWGVLCHLSQDQGFSGLDEVSTAIYLQIWQAAGARLGVWTAGRIAWAVEPAAALAPAAGEQLDLGLAEGGSQKDD